jgi:hypothetical protein
MRDKSCVGKYLQGSETNKIADFRFFCPYRTGTEHYEKGRIYRHALNGIEYRDLDDDIYAIGHTLFEHFYNLIGKTAPRHERDDTAMLSESLQNRGTKLYSTYAFIEDTPLSKDLQEFLKLAFGEIERGPKPSAADLLKSPFITRHFSVNHNVKPEGSQMNKEITSSYLFCTRVQAGSSRSELGSQHTDDIRAFGEECESINTYSGSTIHDEKIWETLIFSASILAFALVVGALIARKYWRLTKNSSFKA